MDIQQLSAFSNKKEIDSLSETSLNMDQFKLGSDLQLMDDEIEYMLKKMAEIGPYFNLVLNKKLAYYG